MQNLFDEDCGQSSTKITEEVPNIIQYHPRIIEEEQFLEETKTMFQDETLEFNDMSPQDNNDASQSLTGQERKTQYKNRVLLCDLCEFKAEFFTDLERHRIENHTIAKPLICPICERRFNFKKNLTIHQASHNVTDDSTNNCPECGLEFQRGSSYLGHLKSHQRSDNFRCERCELEFSLKENYIKHLEDVHEGIAILSAKKDYDKNEIRKRGKYICSTCGKHFIKPSLLLRHEMSHSNMKPYECVECSQRFTQKSSLQRHTLQHLGVKENSCPKCGMRFGQRSNLITHIRRVHSLHKNSTGEIDKYPCSECSCSFTKLNSRNRHISRVHRISLPMIFEMDKREDTTEIPMDAILSQLKNLQRYFHKDDLEENGNGRSENEPIGMNNNKYGIQESHSPTEMKQKFPNEGSMSKYVQNLAKEIYEDNIRWLACTQCHRKFQRNYDLLRHIKSHTGEKLFQCDICGRCFALKTTLQAHSRVHEKEKTLNAIQCGICSNTFKSLRALDAHAKTHGKYKPYTCAVCFKDFGSSSNLRAHLKTHNENRKERALSPISLEPRKECPKSLSNEALRQHQCSVCGLVFLKLAHLKEHENIHFKTNIYHCLTCRRSFSRKSALNLHEKIHTGHKTNQCDQCPMKFLRFGDLKRHKIKHTDLRQFLCPHCGKSFKTKTNCRNHITTHHDNIQDTVPTVDESSCEIEQKLQGSSEPITDVFMLDIAGESNTSDAINFPFSHQQIASNKKLISISPLIASTPIEVRYLETEMMEESTNNDRENEDSISFLNKELFFQNALESSSRHPSKSKFININDIHSSKSKLSRNITIQSHESPKKQISIDEIVPEGCPIIHSIQIMKCADKLEQINVDVGIEKPLKNDPNTNEQEEIPSNKQIEHLCPTCSKAFKKRSDLQRHIRTHTKEKPFSCEMCNKSFSLKSTLASHKSTHQERSHRTILNCQVCGKPYSNKSALNIHLRIHTGERPYQCEICSKTFRTSGHRIEHLKIHSKEEKTSKR